ncbi:uncharacterized protein LOC123700487 [Colias croceus]|uniref:uncharacterized protein LOC123700487 n=1 Tax=Colias crocea TaxID=72248 RepID=UPI001E27D799|nr:uncharacterized protein LOC123700487 [Colias croceus]
MVVLYGRNVKSVDIRNLLDFVKRRSIFSDDEILGVPRYPEHLPRAEKILPGHTLLKPAFGMLKSAVKFPHRDISQSVYGNIENIGISYGKNNERVRYTDFRKNNNLAATIIGAIENIQIKNNA